jgi:RNA polymerase-binding protein DksA
MTRPASGLQWGLAPNHLPRDGFGAVPKEDAMLTHTEISASRNRLVALRDRVDGDAAELRDEAFRPGSENGGASDVPLRPEDLGAGRLEDEVTLGLLENEERLAAQIDAALARIDGGSYGQCDVCGRPIGLRRLQAIPYTPHCIDCARAGEPRA